MADRAQSTSAGAKPAVPRILEQLVGLDLIAADRALDDARRLLWMSVFSGRDDDHVQREIGASVQAIKVAMLCHGLTIAEVDSQLSAARFAIWSYNFARLPETTFGQQFQAHAERAELLEKGGKLQ